MLVAKKEPSKWLLVSYLVFFISLLVGVIYLWSWANSHPYTGHNYNCEKLVKDTETIIGRVVVDNYKQDAVAQNKDEQLAYKTILTYPVCFPQGLIETASMNYIP